MLESLLISNRHIAHVFEMSVMKYFWEESRCYTNCVCSRDSRLTAPMCKAREAKQNLRYCPPDDENCVCQLQCLSSTGEKGHNEARLLGFSELPSWDINYQDILENSYNKYRLSKQGALSDAQSELWLQAKEKDIVPGAEKDDIAPGIGKKVILPPSGAGIALPVVGKTSALHSQSIMAWLGPLILPTCATALLSLGDFQKSHREHLFPCTCGDWRSSETQAFVERLGIGVSQPGSKSKEVERLFSRHCPGVSNKFSQHSFRTRTNRYQILSKSGLLPFTHYLAMCELGVKWPGKHDHLKHKHHAHYNMIDPRCAKLKKELAHLTEEEANFRFCVTSETAKEVFEDERFYIEGTGLVHPMFSAFASADGGNHHHMCKRWLNI